MILGRMLLLFKEQRGLTRFLGWKNCRKLSTHRKGHDAPHWNAGRSSIELLPIPYKCLHLLLDSIALFATTCGLIANGGGVREDGTFVEGPDGGGGDEGNEDNGGNGGNEEGVQEAQGNGATKRSAEVLDENSEAESPLEPLVVKKPASRFHASKLRGRPLFSS